jgi:hypothetical protein
LEDCCIGEYKGKNGQAKGGGSYVDLSGHSGLFHCEGVTFAIGENPKLHSRHHTGITGAFVADHHGVNKGGDVEFVNTVCKRGHAFRANRPNFMLQKPESAKRVLLMGNRWTDAPTNMVQMSWNTAAFEHVTTQVDPARQVYTGKCECDGQVFRDDANDGSGFRAMIEWIQKNRDGKVSVV